MARRAPFASIRNRHAGALTAVATGATLAAQKFDCPGLDGRFLHQWDHGSALTVGCTVYASQSPYTQIDSSDPLIAPYGDSGSVFCNDERRSRHVAVFAGNLFRFGRFRVVTCARLDQEQLDTHETAAPAAPRCGVSQDDRAVRHRDR